MLGVTDASRFDGLRTPGTASHQRCTDWGHLCGKGVRSRAILCGEQRRGRVSACPNAGIKAGGISRIYEVGGVATWIAGVAILDPNRAVAGIPPLRWRQFIDDCKAFLDPAKGCAEGAYGKGWSTLDLFGCNPSQPLAHLGVAGLLWAVNGGRVIEIHRGWAMIEHTNNGSRRNFDQRRSRQASLTLPWWIR